MLYDEDFMKDFISNSRNAVEALQDLYISLNRPVQLEQWKSMGGDPCDEFWKGVECFESSIINL